MLSRGCSRGLVKVWSSSSKASKAFSDALWWPPGGTCITVWGSEVRSPARSFAPAAVSEPCSTSGNSAFRAPPHTVTSKLQVSESGVQRTVVSPSHSPVPDARKDQIVRVAVNPGGGGTKQTVIDGVEGTVTNPVAMKKAPPPPPPRTTSKSPLTSPTADTQDGGTGSPRDVLFSQLRSNSVPTGEGMDGGAKRMVAPRSVSKDEGTDQKAKENEELLRTSAIAEEGLRRDSSSSSESVNSQEGLQVSQGQLERKSSGETPPEGGTPNKNSKKLGPPTPPRSRHDVLEQRHQELLRKQKLLQDQYTRLQQLQSSQILQRFSPSRSSSSTPIMNDLKKTGSESNILSKSALHMTPSSGSLTHLAGNAVNFNPKDTKIPPAVVTTANSSNKAPAVPAKPQLKNKIYETDIL